MRLMEATRRSRTSGGLTADNCIDRSNRGGRNCLLEEYGIWRILLIITHSSLECATELIPLLSHFVDNHCPE
jgi:hypothetical protein